MLMQWINQNLNGTTALVVLILMTFIQITPINLNPWSSIAKYVGKAINGELVEKVDKLGNELETFKSDYEKQEIYNCRTRILRFNDEIVRGLKHKKEHFDQILIDVDRYEKYCSHHPNFKNNIATDSIERIKRVYKECGDKGTFL